MPMKILIVEDDPLQLDMIREELNDHFENVLLEDIQTEHEFYEKLSDIIRDPPDLILMDVMLRWTDPAPPEEMPSQPAEVEEEGYFRAGIRCVRRLRKQEQTDPGIPILLFTILSDQDLSQDLLELKQDSYLHVAYLQKTAPVVDLIRKIKEVAPVLQTP